MSAYPKRLIEVDLPIKEVSAHARREKSIRHGHISTLHIWWARRPLAACRAVICASLWPDPADPDCPQAFRDAAARTLQAFAGQVRTERRVGDLCLAHQKEWISVAARGFDAETLEGQTEIRQFLLRFIADFSNWEASPVSEFLDTARNLTQAAHEALGGAQAGPPIMIDPFAGGGALAIEGARIGANVIPSDLNPVAVLIEKVLLEYLPKHGTRLPDLVRKWGDRVLSRSRTALADVYPLAADKSVSVGYIWARTIRCEGPECGVEIPLVRSPWLSSKGGTRFALEIKPDQARKAVAVSVVRDPKDVCRGTVQRGAVTCPVCGYTTPNNRVRGQLSDQGGGASGSRLLSVCTTGGDSGSRDYHVPASTDHDGLSVAKRLLAAFEASSPSDHVRPSEEIPPQRPSPNARGLSAVTRIGIKTFGDLFSDRQLLALAVFGRELSSVHKEITREQGHDVAVAVVSCLALVYSKMAGLSSTFNRWEPNVQCVQDVFGRQAIGLVWDFAESNPIGSSRGSFNTFLDGMVTLLETHVGRWQGCVPVLADACHHFMPDDSATLLFTDPPYFDSVPYADLSDYFYVWLRRALRDVQPELFSEKLTPKGPEAIWNPSRQAPNGGFKDEAFYKQKIEAAFREARRVVKPDGIGVVVFAHKSTEGWEAVLGAILDAGWSVTASWPLDTELVSRRSSSGQQY